MLVAEVNDHFPAPCMQRKENNFLEEIWWKQFKRIDKRDKRLIRIQNQANTRSCRASPRHKFGLEVLNNNNQEYGVQLDESNNKMKPANT